MDAILVSSTSPSPPPPPRSTKKSRARFFSTLEEVITAAPIRRIIASADSLDEAELRKCFEVLHACGLATDPAAKPSSTADAMEGFLDAVFKDWTTSCEQDLPKPVMSFVAREAVPFGYLCDQPLSHSAATECHQSPTCEALVYVHAVYESESSTLTMRFCLRESTDRSHPLNQDDPEFFSPLEQAHIRWMEGNRHGMLRYWLTQACAAKIHKHNKHLAIWYTRRLVQSWARGGEVFSSGDGSALDFVTIQVLDGVFSMLGPISNPDGHSVC